MPLDSQGKETGWVNKFAHEANDLSADTTGRQAMQDGYVVNAKVADSTLTATKFYAGTILQTGVYGTSRYGNAVYA